MKEREILNSAYNDSEGITAEFNLNILRRINRELGSDFELEEWEHYAFYNSDDNRIEMHLESRSEQLVRLNGTEIHVAKGESILTEYSHKYTLESFRDIVSGYYTVENVWTDENNLFSIQYLVAK